jgi:hypothetical protein
MPYADARMWTVLTFAFWLLALIPSIPAIIDGSIFKAPYLSDPAVGLPTAIARDPPPRRVPAESGGVTERRTPSTVSSATPTLPPVATSATPSEKFERQMMWEIDEAVKRRSQ